MHANKPSKNTAFENINEVAEILAVAFIRLQENKALTGDSRDNLVDLRATPSIHADSKNSSYIEV